MILGLAINLALMMGQPQACIATREAPGPAQLAVGKAWYIGNEPIKVLGKTYRKYGLPRVLRPGEVKPFANYDGAILAIEAGPNGTDEVLYVLTNFDGCEFQPYVMQA